MSLDTELDEIKASYPEQITEPLTWLVHCLRLSPFTEIESIYLGIGSGPHMQVIVKPKFGPNIIFRIEDDSNDESYAL